jgi:hypothetical protein
MSIVLATLPDELAEHWRNVLTDAGITCELRTAGDQVEVMVAEGDHESARALFDSPFEDDKAKLEEEGQRPALAPNERTETLVVTEHAVIADRLSRTLHQAGLFADVRTGMASSVFGIEGTPQFTVTVSEAKRDEACQVLEAWAKTNAHDFAKESGLSGDELFEVLRSFIRVLP